MPGRAPRRAGWALLALTMGACEPPTDPIDPPQRRLVVHAVLNASALRQWVQVEHLDGSFGHRLVTLGGVEVTLASPGGEVFTGEEVEGETGLIYRITLPPEAAIVPGGTYTLRVRTALGEEASGTTTVPNLTAAVQVQRLASFDRSRDTLILHWNRVPLASRYEVSVDSELQFQQTSFFERTYVAFTDTSFALPGTARSLDNDLVFPPGTAIEIAVSAVDDNYYTYYHHKIDPFAGAPPSRLTGALGVFGSVAPIIRRRYDDVR